MSEKNDTSVFYVVESATRFKPNRDLIASLNVRTTVLSFKANFSPETPTDGPTVILYIHPVWQLLATSANEKQLEETNTILNEAASLASMVSSSKGSICLYDLGAPRHRQKLLSPPENMESPKFSLDAIFTPPSTKKKVSLEALAIHASYCGDEETREQAVTLANATRNLAFTPLTIRATVSEIFDLCSSKEIKRLRNELAIVTRQLHSYQDAEMYGCNCAREHLAVGTASKIRENLKSGISRAGLKAHQLTQRLPLLKRVIQLISTLRPRP